jgi:hypothetical protein
MIEQGRVEATSGTTDIPVGPTPPPIADLLAPPPAAPSEPKPDAPPPGPWNAPYKPKKAAPPPRKPAPPAKPAPGKKKPGRPKKAEAPPAPPRKHERTRIEPPPAPPSSDGAPPIERPDDDDAPAALPPSERWELEDGIFLAQLGFSVAGTVRGHPDAWKLTAPYDERLGSRLVKVANAHGWGTRFKNEIMLGVALATAAQICMMREKIEKARGELAARSSSPASSSRQPGDAPPSSPAPGAAPGPTFEEMSSILDRMDGIMQRATSAPQSADAA